MYTMQDIRMASAEVTIMQLAVLHRRKCLGDIKPNIVSSKNKLRRLIVVYAYNITQRKRENFIPQ